MRTPAAYSSAPWRTSPASRVACSRISPARCAANRLTPSSMWAACSWARAMIASLSSRACSTIRPTSTVMRCAWRTSSSMADLIHELQDGPLVDHNVVRERDSLAGCDQHLETLDEEQDVRDVTPSGGFVVVPTTAAEMSYSVIPPRSSRQPRWRCSSVPATPGGTTCRDVPAERRHTRLHMARWRMRIRTPARS